MSLMGAHRFRALIVALGSVFILASLGPASSGAMAAQPSKLVDIRAAHHPGYDRIVFEFAGPGPSTVRARWATDLRLDPSHRRAHVQGFAFLRLRFAWSVAHKAKPPHASTFGPRRRAFNLPNIAHVVLLGDVEGEVSIGIGLMRKTKILRTAALRNPSRYVVDVSTRFAKGKVKVFFVDERAVVDGVPPYVRPVVRKVPLGLRADGAMLRLYAGPTAAESRRGLRFAASGTTGYRDLWGNSRGVTRLTLRGPCDSGGSAETTVANQVMPTLRSRPAIDWVKIYDRFGHTGRPWGRSDSIPGCLEP